MTKLTVAFRNHIGFLICDCYNKPQFTLLMKIKYKYIYGDFFFNSPLLANCVVIYVFKLLSPYFVHQKCVNILSGLKFC